MPNGKYFLIKHTYSSLVLELENGRDRSGVAVTLAKLTSQDHQLWYYDHTTFTIRNKLNDHCLDLKGDKAISTTYQRIRDTQHWQMSDVLIKSRADLDQVVGFSSSEPVNAGTQAVVVDKLTSDHKQRWQFVYCAAKYFAIRNQSSDKVLDVAGGNTKPGASIIMYKSKENRCNNQLWYEDQQGFIRSKLNDYLLTKESGTDDITLHPTKPNLSRDEKAKRSQGWLISGSTLQNAVDSNMVLEFRVPGGAMSFVSGMLVNPVLCQAKYDGKETQQWFIDYLPVHSLTMRNSHSGLGKHCIISHRLSKMLLTSVQDGVALTLGKIDADGHYDSSQLWNVNDISCTIQSVADKKCLAVNENGDGLTLISTANGIGDSITGINWKFTGSKIHQQMSPASVLTVADDEPEEGTSVTIATFDGSEGQHWLKEHVPARCFYIHSYLNDRVLHVQSDQEGVEGKLVMWDKYSDPAEEQLWYEDEEGLLRSMLNGYVPDAGRGVMVLREYDGLTSAQKWIRDGDTIRNMVDKDSVLDITRRCTDIGTHVISFKECDQQNQKWYYTTETLKQQSGQAVSYFHLRSHLNNRVLSIGAGSPQPGANVIMWDKLHPPAAHQLWYFDKDGVLLSKLNRCAPVPDMEMTGRRIKMRRYDSTEACHKFIRDGELLRNKAVHNLVMDITRKNKDQGATVSVFRHISGNANQKWHFDFV